MMPDTKIERLVVGDEDRLRRIRLRALRDAPDAFETTFEAASGQPLESWRQQLETPATICRRRRRSRRRHGAGCPAGRPRGHGRLDLDVGMLLKPATESPGIGPDRLAVVGWARSEGFQLTGPGGDRGKTRPRWQFPRASGFYSDRPCRLGWPRSAGTIFAKSS